MQNKNQSQINLVLFLFGTALIGILGMMAAHHFGFKAMATAADTSPERLRDFTFSVWHSHSISEHGFLVFLTPDGFANKSAYANHATVYLWLMDLLYHVQRVIPALTMRVTSSWLAMLATVLSIGFVVHRRLDDQPHPGKLILLVMGFCYVATLPTYWIAMGKFNVDNGFVFVLPALIMLSHYSCMGDWKSRAFWFWAMATALLMPMAGGLFAISLFVQLVGSSRTFDLRKFAAPILLAAISVIVYLEPVLVLKWLRFTSTNSTWTFRAGLDGDTRYFSNALNSVLFPHFRRPVFLIVIPAVLIFAQSLNRRSRSEFAGVRPEVTNWTFAVNLLSFYALTLLFWPQAVSIHPYLYDAILIGPLVAWVMVNFASQTFSARAFTLWCLVLAFLIMFNLTSIAQAARCTNCAYPQWDLSSDRLG